ncbi:MAG: hypothetical protein LBE15_03790 [Burkholderiales bacterium]|jgi:hypothetical protein|nr:hypothetical protein [Burkholderiales bacterium]
MPKNKYLPLTTIKRHLMPHQMRGLNGSGREIFLSRFTTIPHFFTPFATIRPASMIVNGLHVFSEKSPNAKKNLFFF